VTIGCAGGVDISINGVYKPKNVKKDYKSYKLAIKGLSGGHSGIQINLGRGNANKLMNRLLFEAVDNFGLRIATIDGGSLRNAIPRESFAEVLVPTEHKKAFEEFIAKTLDLFKFEYKTTDPELDITIEKIDTPEFILGKTFQNVLMNSIYACPNGVFRMSPDIEGLIQTSNNLARVIVKDGKFTIHCLTRSAINTEKMDFAQSIKSVFELAGFDVKLSGAYTGWIPKPEAPIVKTMSNIYKELFNEDVKVTATHGGLECGIIGQNYPDMDMISFGPNITGPHSPDEKVQISSVQKFWKLLLETLKQI
jgi:dipeptidase D